MVVQLSNDPTRARGKQTAPAYLLAMSGSNNTAQIIVRLTNYLKIQGLIMRSKAFVTRTAALSNK